MNKARAATTQLSSESEANLRKVGGQMQNVGKWSTTHVSLPLIAAGGAALKMGYDFDQAFTKMVSLAGVAAGEVDGLKDSVLDLSGRTAVAPAELADALYFLRSSGLDGAEAMDALEMSAKASAAGLGDTAVIADAVSSAMNAYAQSGLSAADATDILVATARAGKAEPEQLAGALGRVLPIASELGVTFDDVGGAIASLSLTGNDASVSATLLTNVLSKLLKPSQQSADMLTAVGMSTDTIRQSIADNGLLGTLEQLRSQLGTNGFVKFMEDAQAVQGALSLTGENVEGVRDVFGQLDDAVGATADAFSAAEQSDGFKLRDGLNDLRIAAVDLGETLLPVAADVAGALGHVASGFAGLPAPVKTGVVALGGVAAAAGPLIWAAGTVVKNTKEIGTAWQWTQQRLRGAEGQLTSLGRAAKAASVLLAGVAAVQIGGDIYNQVSGASDAATRSLQRLNIAIGDVGAGTADANTVMRAFRDLVAAEDDQFKVDNFKVWGDSMDDLVLIGGKTTRTMNDVKDAFGKLLAQSPEQAAVLIDSYQQALDGLGRTLDGLDPQSAEFDDLMGQFRENNDVVRFMRDAYTDAVGSQEALTAATTEATTEAETYADATGNVGDETAAATVKTSDLADDLASVADAYDTVRSASDRYRDALSMTIDPQRDLVEANEDLYKTMDALKAGNKENGDSLDIATEKGRANRDLVQAQVDAILAYGPAARAMGKSAFDAALDQEGMRVALVDTMDQLGFTREEAEGYIATLGLTPDALATSVTLENQLATEEQINGILEDLGEIDEGAAAEIKALVDSGQLDDALAKVQQLQLEMAKGASMPLRTYNLGNNVRVMARGDVVDQPTLAVFGEAGAEVVLPLTNQARMSQLLNDSRVRPLALHALGIPGFADGGIIGRVLQTGATSAPASPVTSVASRMSNMHEFGALSDADYRAYLAEQLDGLEEFSDEWAAVKREIKGLDDDELRRQDDKAKAAKEQADAVIAEEDRKMAALYETGALSNQQYEAYLQQRMGDYEQYSAGWMEKWRLLSGVQEQAERDAEDRRQKEAEDALHRLDLLYSRAENRHRLSVAESDLADSWNDVDEARQEVADAEDDAGRARAEQAVADALIRVADDAWEGAKARAAVNGFAEGTADWGRFMRSEVGAYIGAHPELAGRLNQWLESVPRFAAGGHAVGWGVAGENGAELINFGAGANVYNADLSRMMMSAASLGGGVSAADGLLRQIVTRLDRLEGGVNFNGPISVGTRDDLRALRSEADRMLWKMRVGG